MRSWTRSIAGVLLPLVLGAAAAAQEARTLATTADEVAVAASAGDADAIAALTKLRNQPPWVVADALLATQRAAAAEAFAAAGEGPRFDGLSAYVAARKKEPAKRDGAAAVALFDQAMATRKADALLALIPESSASSSAPTPIGIHLEIRRAAVLRATKQTDAAQAAYARADAAADVIGWSFGAVQALQGVARCARTNRDRDAAVGAYDRQHALFLRLGDPLSAARALMNLGLVHGTFGEYANSLDALERAARFIEREPSDAEVERLQAKLLRNLGSIQKRMGESSAAAVTLREALARIERNPAASSKRQHASVLIHLAEVRIALGDLDGAQRRTRQLAELVADDAQYVGEVAALEVKIGAERGDWVRVGRYAATAEAGFRARGKELLAARAGLYRTISARHLGDVAQAAERLRTFTDGEAADADAVIVPYALGELSRAYQELGRQEDARSASDRAIELADGLGQTEDAVRLRSQRAEFELTVGRVADAMAFARAAIRGLPQLIRDAPRTLAPGARSRWATTFDVGLRAAVQADDASAVFEFLECGRAGALLEGLRGRTQFVRHEVSPELLEEGSTRRRERAAAELAISGARARGLSRKQIRELHHTLEAARRAERGAIERIELSARGAAKIVYPRPIGIGAARAALGERDVFVSLRCLESSTVALVVTPRDARILSLAPTCEHRDTLLRVSRGQSLGDASAVVRAAFVAPLGLSNGTRRVYVSADGPLSALPWNWMLAGPVAVLIPSATSWLTLRAQPLSASEHVLGVGNPHYPRSSGFAPLPATQAEVEGIAEPKTMLAGRAATSSAVLEALADRSTWRAVHLACHGVFDPRDPWNSAVVLAPAPDGVSRVTALDLLGRTAFRTDLAVLSACELAQGADVTAEGAIGVPYALLISGARVVVAHLWKADDDAARVFLSRFYASWRDGGEDAASALADAQAHMQRTERWRAPTYWAGWVLWGAPE